MTDPRNPDDSWAELARELGVDDPGSAKPSPTRTRTTAEVIELTESDADEVGDAPPRPYGEDGDRRGGRR